MINSIVKLYDQEKENGKCICVSFPLHEIHLIDDLDNMAKEDDIPRSLELRRLIRKEKSARKLAK